MLIESDLGAVSMGQTDLRRVESLGLTTLNKAIIEGPQINLYFAVLLCFVQDH